MTYGNSIELMQKAQERMLKQIFPVLKLLSTSIPVHQLTDSIRLALDSTEMAQISNWVSVSNRELQQLQRQLQASERLFKLPALMEASQLLTGLSHGSSSYIQQNSEFSQSVTAVLDAMASMKTPWLNTENIQRSYNGFARLQELGHALDTMPAFDLHLTETLRLDLGDWRQEIVWPSEILDDVVARTSFYDERGLNSDLIAFPTAAFQESIKLAGLSEIDDSPIPLCDGGHEKEIDGFKRTVKAYKTLLQLEVSLRRFIVQRMEKKFGSVWIKRQVPGKLRKKWKERQQEDQDNHEHRRLMIEYADLGDYVDIITRNDNWQEVFQCIFRHKESVQESFRRIHPIRNSTMHARSLLSHDDELFLYVEVKRLTSAMKFQD